MRNGTVFRDLSINLSHFSAPGVAVCPIVEFYDALLQVFRLIYCQVFFYLRPRSIERINSGIDIQEWRRRAIALGLHLIVDCNSV